MFRYNIFLSFQHKSSTSSSPAWGQGRMPKHNFVACSASPASRGDEFCRKMGSVQLRWSGPWSVSNMRRLNERLPMRLPDFLSKLQMQTWQMPRCTTTQKRKKSKKRMNRPLHTQRNEMYILDCVMVKLFIWPMVFIISTISSYN